MNELHDILHETHVSFRSIDVLFSAKRNIIFPLILNKKAHCCMSEFNIISCFHGVIFDIFSLLFLQSAIGFLCSNILFTVQLMLNAQRQIKNYYNSLIFINIRANKILPFSMKYSVKCFFSLFFFCTENEEVKNSNMKMISEVYARERLE